MDEEIKIDSQVEIPKQVRKSKWAGLVLRMADGDSIHFPAEKSVRGVAAAIRSAGFRATVRSEGDGFRVWKSVRNG